MATFLAALAAARAAQPQQMVKPNLQGADVQCFISQFTVPVGGLAIADIISWGYLPLGARLMPGSAIYCAAGTASSTLNLGDAVAPARYMAAASVASVAKLPAEAQFASGALFEVGVVKPGDATDHSELRSVVAGAGLPAGQVITLVALYAGQN